MLVDTKANNFDFLGDMDIEMQDGQSHPLPLLATPFELTTSRQIALPKGQAKMFDSVFFVPQNAQKIDGRLQSLRPRRRSDGGRNAACFVARMPSYQYHFVVLARIPEQYGYLDRDRFFCVKPFLKRISTTISSRITRSRS